MKRLDRKLLRDAWTMKTQAIAIALVMASGVATLIMSLSTVASLKRTQQAYYESHRFADVFARLKRAPDALAPRLARIPGVAEAQTRIAVEVMLDLPGMAVPAAARLISLDPDPAASLNRLHLRRGRFPDPAGRHEAVVSEAFAQAHALQLGDSVRAIVNGRIDSLAVVGVALSPEYIYQIRPGEFMPDDKRFGLFWMDRRQLAAAYGLEGAFNDVALALSPGAPEAPAIDALDDLIAPYGGQGAYGRADQPSNKLVTDELSQLRAMASIPPVIFLAVSAFLLNVVVSRLVQTQREQIAMLKALGYTRAQVGAHFLKFVLLLTVVGLGIGTAAGAWLGRGLAGLYARYFRFPEMVFHLDPAAVAFAWSASAGAVFGGVAFAVMRAMRLPPAEGMRPAEPDRYRPLILERLGLKSLLGRIPRMILRQLERKPLASAASVAGIALAVAIVILGSFSRDIVDYVVDLQFFEVQRYDASALFIEPASSDAIREIRSLEGVVAAEGYRSVPATFRRAHRFRRAALLGLDGTGDLMRVLDMNGRDIPLSPHGLALSATLADRLGAAVGDEIEIQVMEGQRPLLRLPVMQRIDDVSGASAYLDRAGLNRLLRESDVSSGAFIKVDPAASARLFEELKARPRVAVSASKSATLESFRALMAENVLRMRLINVTFAGIIAFGVVYNAARISLAERSRELATLRVIGFTRNEVSLVFLGEIAILTLAAAPLGMLLGRIFSAVAVVALATESQRFPLVVSPATYGFAVGTVVLAATLSGLVVRRNLDRLDLLSVLKSA